MIEQIIRDSFQKALNKMMKGVNHNNFRYINESVFRYYFIRSLPAHIGAEDEWKRIDLLLHDKRFQYPIKFKQYATRPLNMFNGKSRGYKGGAGNRNFSEFIHSAKKLVELVKDDPYSDLGCNFKNAYFILHAFDDLNSGKRQFSEFYTGEHKKTLKEEGVRCREICSDRVETKGILSFGWVIKLSPN